MIKSKTYVWYFSPLYTVDIQFYVYLYMCKEHIFYISYLACGLGLLLFTQKLQLKCKQDLTQINWYQMFPALSRTSFISCCMGWCNIKSINTPVFSITLWNLKRNQSTKTLFTLIMVKKNFNIYYFIFGTPLYVD